MHSAARVTAVRSKRAPTPPIERNGVPELHPGDRLSIEEFERRYEAMPELKKAELIEGVVYMSSAVRIDQHGAPHSSMIAWIGYYHAFTPGVEAGDNSSVSLARGRNRPQPDALLRIVPVAIAATSITERGYVLGSPEWVGEVTASTASYDLHDKLHAYERNGVKEYVVWRVEDRAIDWFMLRGAKYRRAALPRDGIQRSKVFPGLWLDVEAMLDGDLRRVLKVLDQGIGTDEHQRFVAGLAAHGASE